MSHPTHSYAPLDSAPPYSPDITIRESHSPPSSPPPPLYPISRLSSNSPPRGAGGYRPDSMLYSKPVTSTALLSGSEHDDEKAHHNSTYQDDIYDKDTSYPPASNLRSISPSPSSSSATKSSHYRGKRWLSYLRSLFAIFNILLSIVAFAMIAVVIWAIYAKDKTNWQQPTSNPQDPNKPHPNRTYAFPQAIEPLPNNLIIATSLFAVVFNIIAALAPCWRSNKKFHKKKFAKSEVFEIVGNILVIAAGAAGVYFAITTKSDLEHSLWGFTCEVTHNPTKYRQARLFADIKYANACNNYDAAVYTLVVVVAMSAVILGTFLVNFCLKKRKGEYKKDDSAFCLGACNCCGASAAPLVDCFECCCACFELCS